MRDVSHIARRKPANDEQMTLRVLMFMQQVYFKTSAKSGSVSGRFNAAEAEQRSELSKGASKYILLALAQAGFIVWKPYRHGVKNRAICYVGDFPTYPEAIVINQLRRDIKRGGEFAKYRIPKVAPAVEGEAQEIEPTTDLEEPEEMQDEVGTLFEDVSIVEHDFKRYTSPELCLIINKAVEELRCRIQGYS